MRTIVVRLARAMGGGVDYWMELPIKELTNFMIELTDQLQSEHDASEDRR